MLIDPDSYGMELSVGTHLYTCSPIPIFRVASTPSWGNSEQDLSHFPTQIVVLLVLEGHAGPELLPQRRVEDTPNRTFRVLGARRHANRIT